MWRSLRELDRLLRGDATRPSAMRLGTLEIPAGGLSLVAIVLGLVYGVCMAFYTLFNGGHSPVLQLVATALKVPLLFFLTLLVTFPSLYVFNALVGSRLSALSLLRLLIAALAVMLAVLASFGPIVAFFSVSTTSYPFMLLLNVVVFAIAGLLGLKFLLLTLHRLTLARNALDSEVQSVYAPYDLEEAARQKVEAATVEPAGALDPLEGRVLGRDVTTVFRFWVIVFGLVGAQMAWVLRPFLGAPDVAFTWFRPRGSSFFEAVLNALGNLVGG